jgi:hypothetical protein
MTYERVESRILNIEEQIIKVSSQYGSLLLMAKSQISVTLKVYWIELNKKESISINIIFLFVFGSFLLISCFVLISALLFADHIHERLLYNIDLFYKSNFLILKIQEIGIDFHFVAWKSKKAKGKERHQ